MAIWQSQEPQAGQPVSRPLPKMPPLQAITAVHFGLTETFSLNVQRFP